MVDDAEAVQPRVTDIAAEQEPPVANCRIRDRKLRDPPAVAVGLRIDDARLAVLDVAKLDVIDALRARAHDRVVAQLAGPLEDVELRAVVMRLVEDRRSLFDQAHPLTAPPVRPETMYFCSFTNSRIAGTAASKTPAENGPQSSLYCWLTHCCMPSPRVYLDAD